MNRCFLIGKVLNEPEFEFLYMKKNISIAYFWIKTIDKNIVKVYGFDTRADFIYRNINKGKMLIIDGEIRSKKDNIEIEINKIKEI